MNSTESSEVLQYIYLYSYYLYFKETSACLMGESLKGPIAWKTLSPHGLYILVPLWAYQLTEWGKHMSLYSPSSGNSGSAPQSDLHRLASSAQKHSPFLPREPSLVNILCHDHTPIFDSASLLSSSLMFKAANTEM